jgi:hypothetical protein
MFAGTGITEAQRQAVGRAAMLTAIAEDLAARRLMDASIAIDDIVRAEGAARRAVQDLRVEADRQHERAHKHDGKFKLTLPEVR